MAIFTEMQLIHLSQGILNFISHFIQLLPHFAQKKQNIPTINLQI